MFPSDIKNNNLLQTATLQLSDPPRTEPLLETLPTLGIDQRQVIMGRLNDKITADIDSVMVEFTLAELLDQLPRINHEKVIISGSPVLEALKDEKFLSDQLAQLQLDLKTQDVLNQFESHICRLTIIADKASEMKEIQKAINIWLYQKAGREFSDSMLDSFDNPARSIKSIGTMNDSLGVELTPGALLESSLSLVSLGKKTTFQQALIDRLEGRLVPADNDHFFWEAAVRCFSLSVEKGFSSSLNIQMNLFALIEKRMNLALRMNLNMEESKEYKLFQASRNLARLVNSDIEVSEEQMKDKPWFTFKNISIFPYYVFSKEITNKILNADDNQKFYDLNTDNSKRFNVLCCQLLDEAVKGKSPEAVLAITLQMSMTLAKLDKDQAAAEVWKHLNTNHLKGSAASIISLLQRDPTIVEELITFLKNNDEPLAEALDKLTEEVSLPIHTLYVELLIALRKLEGTAINQKWLQNIALGMMEHLPDDQGRKYFLESVKISHNEMVADLIGSLKQNKEPSQIPSRKLIEALLNLAENYPHLSAGNFGSILSYINHHRTLPENKESAELNETSERAWKIFKEKCIIPNPKESVKWFDGSSTDRAQCYIEALSGYDLLSSNNVEEFWDYLPQLKKMCKEPGIDQTIHISLINRVLQSFGNRNHRYHKHHCDKWTKLRYEIFESIPSSVRKALTTMIDFTQASLKLRCSDSDSIFNEGINEFNRFLCAKDPVLNKIAMDYLSYIYALADTPDLRKRLVKKTIDNVAEATTNILATFATETDMQHLSNLIVTYYNILTEVNTRVVTVKKALEILKKLCSVDSVISYTSLINANILIQLIQGEATNAYQPSPDLVGEADNFSKTWEHTYSGFSAKFKPHLDKLYISVAMKRIWEQNKGQEDSLALSFADSLKMIFSQEGFVPDDATRLMLSFDTYTISFILKILMGSMSLEKTEVYTYPLLLRIIIKLKLHVDQGLYRASDKEYIGEQLNGICRLIGLTSDPFQKKLMVPFVPLIKEISAQGLLNPEAAKRYAAQLNEPSLAVKIEAGTAKTQAFLLEN